MSGLNAPYRRSKEKGVMWTASRLFHRQISFRVLRVIDRCVVWIKKRKSLSENETVMLDIPSLTVSKNRRFWDTHDWSQSGEEWTLEVKKYKGLDPIRWKANLINETMFKYIKKGSTILEIGPGGGRWTDILLKLAGRLIIADISEKCLNLCKERFKTHNNIEYCLIDERLDFIANDSIDYIWSYDVFVHINPADIEKYIDDFQRILKLGGCAIIHHSGTYSSEKDRREEMRSYMNGNLFAHLVEKHKMKMVEQNDTLVHYPGDLISVFIKSDSVRND